MSVVKTVVIVPVGSLLLLESSISTRNSSVSKVIFHVSAVGHHSIVVSHHGRASRWPSRNDTISNYVAVARKG